MLTYLLNRILWIVPALWLICSVVFILIKLIPGEAAFLLEEDTAVKSTTRAAIYRQYLERTGQHLPLFYVSIKSFTEPDTLYKIQPPKEQIFLRKLTWQYGSWPLTVDYYYQLKNFNKVSARIPDPQLRALYQKQAAILLSSTDPAIIQQTLSSLRKIEQFHSVDPLNLQTITAAENSFTSLKQYPASYKNYIPFISWHGTQNQYHQWISKAVKGDLGISLRDARPVAHILAEAINNTLLLSICSLLFIFAIAILLNLLIIRQDYQQLRKPVLNILYVIDTIPVFMLALLLIILLASNQYLSLFPVYGLGAVPDTASWLEVLSIRLYHLVIPVLCLTLGNIPYVGSQLYTAMREVTYSDFIQTARAKGVAEGVVVRKHILKNSLLPLITLFSGFIPALLGGAVVIEVIFAIPGMGQLLVDSVLARDYPVILGIVLVMALAKILAHIIADVLYYLADPRIRFS
jgi:peptide/nickel transport system permease protein